MKALVLLGCPEAPSQTPIGLYASYKLNQMGYDVTVSSNPAAGKILDISDPEGVYVKKRVDISRDAEEVAEFADMVESSTDADIIAVRAFHNPNPIKVRFDKYLKTLEE